MEFGLISVHFQGRAADSDGRAHAAVRDGSGDPRDGDRGAAPQATSSISGARKVSPDECVSVRGKGFREVSWFGSAGPSEEVSRNFPRSFIFHGSGILPRSFQVPIRPGTQQEASRKFPSIFREVSGFGPGRAAPRGFRDPSAKFLGSFRASEMFPGRSRLGSVRFGQHKGHPRSFRGDFPGVSCTFREFEYFPRSFRNA